MPKAAKRPGNTPFYAINANGDEPEIWIYGDIGDSWFEETVSARDFVAEINELEASRITVRINSLGGSVADGLAIYNAIKRHEAHVTTINDGVAMSCASMILMAGDTVQMASNAILMIHAPWMYTAGNAAELREHADNLDTWAEAMATCYARSGLTEAEVDALLSDGVDHYYTAAEALDLAFVDQVTQGIDIAAKYRVPEHALARFHPPEHIQLGNAKERTMPKKTAPQNDPANNTDPAAAAGNNPGGQPAADPAPAAGDDGQQQPGSDPAPQPAAASLADFHAAEKTRREAIRRTCSAAVQSNPELDKIMQACLDDPAVTPEQASARILAKWGEGAEPVAGSIRHIDGAGEERFRDDAVATLLTRAGMADDDQRKAARASSLRSYRLSDLARACLDRGGIAVGSMNQLEMVGAAFTNTASDFPVLLENTMHKAVQMAYANQPDTWSRFCSVGSVSDFRAHNRYRTGSLGNLDELTADGEFKQKSVPDGEKSSISAGTRGNIINLTREMIVNDDLGAFLNMARDMGRAGARSVEVLVYTLLAENSGLGPVLNDGKTLFHADHGNIGAGAALSMVAIDNDRVLMASQTDVGGNEFLDLRPSVLLVPVSLGGQARTINDAQYDPDTANKLQKPNMVRGLFEDVVDTPRLTGTRRYLFADPNDAPVIEVAFLNGEREPFIEMQDAFTVDGVRYKVRLDVGVAGIDYRGGVTDAGA